MFINNVSIRYRVGTFLQVPGGRNPRSFPLFHQHAPWQRQRKGKLGGLAFIDDASVPWVLKNSKYGGIALTKVEG